MNKDVEITPDKVTRIASKPGTVKPPSFIHYKSKSINDAVINETLYRIDNCILEFIDLGPNLIEGHKISIIISYKPTIRKPNEVELEKLTKILSSKGWAYRSLQAIASPGEVKFSITEI